MATIAITYRTGSSARDLRTVIVEDVHGVKLVTGGDLVVGKLVHGTTCAHKFWDEQLGTSGDDFAVEASQVVAQRPMNVAVKAVHK